jgi:hypothetical protein
VPDPDVQAVKGGPSEAAVERAWATYSDPPDMCPIRIRVDAAVHAMHDPALGLDRSVRLGDVVEWLERRGVGTARIADCLREFGATTHAE